MESNASQAESSAVSPDAPLTAFPTKRPKQAGTFDDEPAASMKFATITNEPALQEFMILIHLDRADFAKYILEGTSILCKNLSPLSEEKQIHYLELEAMRLKLIYSYCNIFYVANPYMALLPDVDYEEFVDTAKKRLGVNIETAALPESVRQYLESKPSKPAPTTELNEQKNGHVVNNVVREVIEDPAMVNTSEQNDSQVVTSAEESNVQTDVISDVTPLPTAAEQPESGQTAESTPRKPPPKLVVPTIIRSPKTDLPRIKQGDHITEVLRRISKFSGRLSTETPSLNRLNTEKLMVLDLLSLEASQRDAYIVQCAIELDLLIDDKTTNHLQLNPECNLKCAKGINPTVVVESANLILTSNQTKRNVLESTLDEETTDNHADSADDLIIESETILPPPNGSELSRKAVIFKAKLEKKAAAKAEKEAKRLADEAKRLGKKLKKVNDPKQKATTNEVINTLMLELQKTKITDAKESETKAPRKRGSRSKAISCSSDTSVASTVRVDKSLAYRNSILKSLQDIYDTVEFHGAAGLGQLSQSKLYAKFVAKFDETVTTIQKKLKDNPIQRPPVAVEIPLLKTPPKAPSFSEDLNQIIVKYCTDPKIRMKPMGVLDEFVDVLIERNLGKLVTGEIRINAFNVAQGYITATADPTAPTTEECVKDTIVETILLRQCAMHGDLVRAFVFFATPDTELRNNPQGFVTQILEKRNDRMVIGHLSLNKNQVYVILKPTTKRIVDLKIDKKVHAVKNPDIKLDDQMLYMAKVIRWHNETPIGEITKVIGDKNALGTNNQAILLENKLEVPSFSQTILDSLPNELFEIPAEEYVTRENLTAQYVFTIDPATARDLDDALSVEQLPNGNYKVGVHISDVTYFLPELSELDEVVREQATSIYLVDTVYHMLPRSLCMTCSLLPGQDKLSFSVFWEMTEAGEIVSTRFARTIINSCVQLAYSHAQRMITEPDHIYQPDELPAIRFGFEASVIAEKVRLLHRLAKPLRQQRFDRHSFTINQAKIYFQLDTDTGEPLSFERYTQMDSNWLIEEFMLLANQSVAARIHEHYPNEAILRNHMAPKLSKVEGLIDKLRQYGFNMELKSPSASDITETFYKLMNDPTHSDTVQSVLSDMLMRTINRAEYFCSDDVKPMSHFALGIPIYTHFTSPIRRYPDIMVHRLLAASLKLSHKPTRSPEDLQMIADRCNVQKYNAKLAGEASTNLYFKYFVQKRGKWQMKGVVVEMCLESMFEVMLLETGMKVKINLNKHKPSVGFKVTQTKPLSVLVQFGGKAKRTIRCETFAEVRVELSVNASGNIQANLVEPEDN